MLILDDLEKVKRLQDGHGGFASHMKKVGDVIPCSCTTFAVDVRTVNNVKLHTFSCKAKRMQSDQLMCFCVEVPGRSGDCRW